ncbi:hypothetical protein C7974DRAFT_57194 [Boeremia exigua]|uniref:uncharacterized protein n=1 Tax=Boeremia exigua TaxID=749465 RepID=UPI001E8E9DD8|nr:uncharacterized protein C7974DRAFT_57194 [Boeremia exigua]KAH6614998.1 hypothetical protein C7974DRAFT_57194 [Boeremia exigua]
MPARKRAASEMDVDEQPEPPTTLRRLRSMWQFANLAQYIAIFGDAVKIDKDFDIEELESECLKPGPSEKLAQIGLALLKHVSSHKGLTPAIFDEYTRRQFVAKAPERNPFGEDEEPSRFDDFDVFTKIRVLQQLSTWTLNNPNSIREKLAATDSEQTLWRMEPTGWDSQDRVLFVLDDNRMYRRTDPAPPAPSQKAKAKPKPKAKKAARGTRASKRQKQSTPETADEGEEEEAAAVQEVDVVGDDGLGGMKWECLCVTLEDYRDYLSSIRKSRDPNEKMLYRRLEEEVLPVMEGLADEQARKQARKAKELENLQKLATAKRSSRISARVEKQKEVEEVQAAERKRREEVAMARAEHAKQKKLEDAHDSRRMTREQRLRERETAKVLKEEELRKLQENEQKLASNNARLSERHLKAMMKQHEADLKRLNEEEDWFFDCEKCGVYGSNLNDKSPQVSCEKCNVWQHVKCHGISEEEVEDAGFEFVCTSCKRKEEDAHQPKLPPLKLRMTSASPSQGNGEESSLSRRLESVKLPAPRPTSSQSHQPHFQPQPWVDGPSLSPRGQARGPPGIQNSEAAYGSPSRIPDASSSPIRQRPASSSRPADLSFKSNGMGSSPPPFNLPQGPASPFKSIRMPLPQNGSSFGLPNPFGPSQHTPIAQSFNQSFNQSFSRPGTAAGSAGSPVKHSPANSPRPTNGLPAMYNFNSPHSSFPPSSAQRPSFSPTKHSSPAPMPHMSSPAPAPVRIAPSPSQMPAQMLPDAIPAPLKHDGARPASSHALSDTPVFPPSTSLEPAPAPLNLSPPVKKSSPAPDRHRLAPLGHSASPSR